MMGISARGSLQASRVFTVGWVALGLVLSAACVVNNGPASRTTSTGTNAAAGSGPGSGSGSGAGGGSASCSLYRGSLAQTCPQGDSLLCGTGDTPTGCCGADVPYYCGATALCYPDEGSALAACGSSCEQCVPIGGGAGGAAGTGGAGAGSGGATAGSGGTTGAGGSGGAPGVGGGVAASTAAASSSSGSSNCPIGSGTCSATLMFPRDAACNAYVASNCCAQLQACQANTACAQEIQGTSTACANDPSCNQTINQLTGCAAGCGDCGIFAVTPPRW